LKRLTAFLIFVLVLIGYTGAAAKPIQPFRQSATVEQSAPDASFSPPGEIVPPASTFYRYAYGPLYFPADVNPLTGLPVRDQSLMQRRPIVIKVTNFPRSVRPQWGLSQADHVYEYYIGDEMSRFVGVFYGKDASRVGPVRSARLFDEHVMRMYRGIFVFGYADDPVLDFLTRADILPFLLVERPNNCPPLCRIGSSNAYNNLFADTGDIGAYLVKQRVNNDRQDLTGMRFEAEVPRSGNPGEKFSIRYSPVSYNYWEYDAASGYYLRFQETIDDFGKGASYAPLTDSLTGSQLSAANVIILLVPHGYFIKYSKAAIIEQALKGKGAGFAFRDGKLYPLIWEHLAVDELLQLRLPDGRLYPLKPGNTWFEILSDQSSLAGDGPAAWKFDFVFP
jgi:Protein of unknown function (DUF3048) N-terminal domain/Protein of unknown function (DUF3048) C-terminal domain